MLSWFAGRMLGTLLKDGLVWLGVESSVAGEFSGQQAVRISNAVEMGEVEYLPQSVSTMQMPSTSFGVKSLGKGKRKKDKTLAPVYIKRRFESDDESVVLPKGRGFTLMTAILQLP